MRSSCSEMMVFEEVLQLTEAFFFFLNFTFSLNVQRAKEPMPDCLKIREGKRKEINRTLLFPFPQTLRTHY